MLHIRFIRDNVDLIRKDLERRRNKAKLEEFDRLLELDEKVRSLKRDIQDLRTQRNSISKEVGKLKKEGLDASEVMKRAEKVNKKIAAVETETGNLESELKRIQMSIPNILHESVPYGADDEDNEVVKEWGGKPEFKFEVQS
ncbi:MAG: serine--tRNA ligase, partial [Candidatus Thorarchaeota archaeon]|nr:serine--tRNA ligase [Candidatus Thorarchaeota archaeon]